MQIIRNQQVVGSNPIPGFENSNGYANRCSPLLMSKPQHTTTSGGILFCSPYNPPSVCFGKTPAVIKVISGVKNDPH